MVHLKKVDISEKPKLWVMLQKYLEELSVHDGRMRSQNGEYAYRFFEPYWYEEGRAPYFILDKEQTIGFLLKNGHSPYEGIDHSIAEFSILPMHRRNGAGTQAVRQLLIEHKGTWYVHTDASNLAAREFWNRVLGRLRNIQVISELNTTEWESHPVWTFCTHQELS